MSGETKRISRFGQVKIYVGKHFRIFIHEKGWSFILFAAIISWLVAWVVSSKMFESYENTKTGFFAIVSAGIWIGIFNSIQTICKERSIIKYEHRTGLHMSAYILSHVIYQAVICLAQSILMYVICRAYIDFPEDGIIFSSSAPEYLITIFLMILASDIMGIAVSSIVHTPNAAMTVMPFVLILQLIMSGVLFTLSGASKQIANFTISKWGMQAFGSIGDITSLETKIALKHPELAIAYPEVAKASSSSYDPTSSHLLQIWGLFVLFIVAFTAISIISLEFIDKDK